MDQETREAIEYLENEFQRTYDRYALVEEYETVSGEWVRHYHFCWYDYRRDVRDGIWDPGNNLCVSEYMGPMFMMKVDSADEVASTCYASALDDIGEMVA